LNLKWPSVIALVLLAGCARFQPRPIVPAETAKALDSRTLDRPAFKSFLEKNLQRHFDIWPPASWDFDTLTLAAFYYHPSLEIARAQWQVALGGNITAAQRPNPTITASPGYDFTATSVGVNPWIPGVSFDVPIETMGKRNYRKAQARHLSDSARLNIAATAWQVRANLRASLLDFTAARQRVSLLAEENSIQERIVKSLTERFNAGATASTELALVQTALHRIQLDLTDAKRQLADSRVRVADAIGISSSALDGLEITYDLAAPHPAASELLSLAVRDQALQGRADILGALADYAASQSALQLEIAKQYPDIHFGPYYQFNNGDHQFTLSISAELPVLSQNQGPIAEAEARRTESAARFNALQAKVITEIDRAIAVYRATQENLATLEALAADQKKQSDAVTAQAKAGAADELDLLNANLEMSVSALVQLDGRIKAQQAFGALEDAMQRPLEALKPRTIEQQQARAKKENQP
jgi:outer membrane protein, heavy metal efflux system